MILSIPVHFSKEYALVSNKPAKFEERPAHTHKNAANVYSGISSYVKTFNTGEYINEKNA